MAASGNHLLHQQKASVETRIKTLVNNDLKEICRAYNYQVSGHKAALQKRCTEILDKFVREGDTTGFNNLNYRVNNHGKAPPPPESQQHTPTANAYGQFQGTSSSTATMSTKRPSLFLNDTHSSATARMWFSASPFYEDHEAVYPLQPLPEEGAAMPQNRHTVRGIISLTPDQSTRMKADSSLKVLLYCGKGANRYSTVDVEFPNQLEVKINSEDVKGNFKGLKNKPGTTKPTDITDKIRKTSGFQNQFSITYALTKEPFHIAVYLVRYISSATLTQRIKDGHHGPGVISKAQAIREINKANDDPDIVLSSEVMSLKDPVSTLRITLPVRSTVCTHRQCFDGGMFLQMQEQAPQWLCPTCNKSVNYRSLCIDKYFEEILQQTSSSIEKVTVEPNGDWHIIKEDDSKPPAQSSRANRATYDDDFDDDDDLVELPPKPTTSTSRPTNGVFLGNASTRSLLSPMPGVYAMTPPLSSRGPSAAPSTSSAQHGGKRPASSVIDLTLSDDDDEPPRPAKRQSINASTLPGLTSLTSQSYSTPTSLPDPRYTSYSGGQVNSTDAYRTSVNAARPLGHVKNSAAPEQYGLNHVTRDHGSRSGSPFRAASSSSPPFPTNRSNYARPALNLSSSTSQGFQPFVIRPPSGLANTVHGSTSSGDCAPSTSQQPPIRLPPMNTNLPNGYGNISWRDSPNSTYSQSPNG